jgi:hypothetical protein
MKYEYSQVVRLIVHQKSTNRQKVTHDKGGKEAEERRTCPPKAKLLVVVWGSIINAHQHCARRCDGGEKVRGALLPTASSLLPASTTTAAFLELSNAVVRSPAGIIGCAAPGRRLDVVQLMQFQAGSHTRGPR